MRTVPNVQRYHTPVLVMHWYVPKAIFQAGPLDYERKDSGSSTHRFSADDEMLVTPPELGELSTATSLAIM